MSPFTTTDGNPPGFSAMPRKNVIPKQERIASNADSEALMRLESDFLRGYGIAGEAAVAMGHKIAELTVRISALEAENKRLIDYLAGGNGDEGGPDVCPVCEEVLDFDGERETGHADGCKLADALAEGRNA